jgi:ferredoxin
MSQPLIATSHRKDLLDHQSVHDELYLDVGESHERARSVRWGLGAQCEDGSLCGRCLIHVDAGGKTESAKEKEKKKRQKKRRNLQMRNRVKSKCQ